MLTGRLDSSLNFLYMPIFLLYQAFGVFLVLGIHLHEFVFRAINSFSYSVNSFLQVSFWSLTLILIYENLYVLKMSIFF